MSTITPQELEQMRKGLRQRKPPKIRDGMHGSADDGQHFAVRKTDGEFWIDWKVNPGDGMRSRRFHDLCVLPELELERYELGTLVADILQGLANEILQSIPDPMMAMKEAAPYQRLESSWRHWACVAAGHMSGLPQGAQHG